MFGWSISEATVSCLRGCIQGPRLVIARREGLRLNQVHCSRHVQVKFCMLFGACLVRFALLSLQRTALYVVGFVLLRLYLEALGVLRCARQHLFDRDTCSGASSFKFRLCFPLRLRTRVVKLHLHLCAVVVFGCVVVCCF